MDLQQALDELQKLDELIGYAELLETDDYHRRHEGVSNLVDFIQSQERDRNDVLCRWVEGIYNSSYVKSELRGKMASTACKIFRIHLANANLKEEEIELAIELLRKKGYQI